MILVKFRKKKEIHIHSTQITSQWILPLIIIIIIIIIQSLFQNALTATLNYLDSLNPSGASSSMHHPFPHNVTWNPSIHPLEAPYDSVLHHPFPHYVNPQPPSIAPSIANRLGLVCGLMTSS
jgi:hypothetical protein